jgi:hypothetical protein
MAKAVRKTWPGVLVLVLVLIAACSGPKNYFFWKLQVDPGLHLLPVGGRSPTEPAQGAYYFIFHAAKLTTVDHLERKTPSAERERLLYLETNENQVLDRTVKDDVILTGDFGTVYAEKTCFFNRPVASNYSSVSVGSYLKGFGEEPAELTALPTDLPPLTSLSLVRIFHTTPEYLVVVGNYESTGEIGSLHVGGANGGDWVPGFGGNMFSAAGWNPFLEKYGIPARIDVQDYLQSHRLPLVTVAAPEVLTVINQHYGYNKLIRQDRLENGVVVSSRYLQPSVTVEEQMLNPQCDARLGQQRSMGLPTTY